MPSSTYDLDFVILRFFGSYGPRQHLSWWGGPQSVFIQAVLDAPEAIGEVFNIGSTHEITILDLAHRIKRLSGTPDADLGGG